MNRVVDLIREVRRMCMSRLHRVVAEGDGTVDVEDVDGTVHRVSLLALDGPPPASPGSGWSSTAGMPSTGSTAPRPRRWRPSCDGLPLAGRPARRSPTPGVTTGQRPQEGLRPLRPLRVSPQCARLLRTGGHRCPHRARFAGHRCRSSEPPGGPVRGSVAVPAADRPVQRDRRPPRSPSRRGLLDRQRVGIAGARGRPDGDRR